MSLAAARAQFPHLKDYTDQELLGIVAQSNNIAPGTPQYKKLESDLLGYERTLGQAVKDTAVGIGQGVMGLGKIAGMAAGAVSPMQAFNNPITQTFDEWSQDLNQYKSQGLRNREAGAAVNVDVATREAQARGDGMLGRFAAGAGAQVSNYASNPSLIVQDLASNAPQLLAGGLIGRGVQAGATMLGAGASTAARTGLVAGIGSGGALQGADVGGDTYQRLRAAGVPHEQATEMATEAAVKAGAVSVGLSVLPGAATIERSLIKGAATPLAMGLGRVGTVARVGATEALTEAGDEGYGRYAGNQAVQVADPNVDLMSGVGQAAVQGAATAGPLGTYAGLRTTQRAPQPRTETGEIDLTGVNVGPSPLDTPAYVRQGLDPLADFNRPANMTDIAGPVTPSVNLPEAEYTDLVSPRAEPEQDPYTAWTEQANAQRQLEAQQARRAAAEAGTSVQGQGVMMATPDGTVLPAQTPEQMAETERFRQVLEAQPPAPAEPDQAVAPNRGQLLASLQAASAEMGRTTTRKDGELSNARGNAPLRQVMEAADPLAAMRDLHKDGGNPRDELLDVWHKNLTGKTVFEWKAEQQAKEAINSAGFVAEPQEQLDAQADATREGRKPVMVLGEQEAQTTDLSGLETAVVADPANGERAVVASRNREAVQNTAARAEQVGMRQALGEAQGVVDPSLTAGTPRDDVVAVQQVDNKTGQVLADEIVPAAQVEQVAGIPGATARVVSAGQPVQDRVASRAAAKTVAPEAPAPKPKKAKLPKYGRRASAELIELAENTKDKTEYTEARYELYRRWAEDTDDGAAYAYLNDTKNRSALSKEETAAFKERHAKELDAKAAKKGQELGKKFGASFRTGERKGAGVPAAQAKSVAAAVTRGWTNAPAIEVVQTMADLPEALRNQAEADGATGAKAAYADGKVWVVAGNHSSLGDVATSILHEVAGHHGLRGLLGESFPQVMRQIHAGNPEVRAAADAMMKAEKLSLETAVEEVLADMAETGAVKPSIIERIANALRQLMRKVGLAQFAQGVTNGEVAELVDAARAFVEDGVVGDRVSGPTAYRTDTADARKRPRTNSEGKPISYTTAGLDDFWRYYGDGPTDEQGRPLVEDGKYTNKDGVVKSVDNIGTWNVSDSRPTYRREGPITKPFSDAVKLVAADVKAQVTGAEIKSFWLNKMTLRQIEEQFGKKLPALRDWIGAIMQRSSNASKLAAEADRVALQWEQSVKDPAERKALADILLRASVAELSLDDTSAEYLASLDEGQRTEHAALRSKLANLSPEARQTRRQALDILSRQWEYTRASLESFIRNTVAEPGLRNQRIEDLQREMGRNRGDYFPLSRFGDRIVVGRAAAKDGRDVVSFHESAASADAEVKRLKAAGVKRVDVTLQTERDAKARATTGFIGSLHEMIDSSEADSGVKDSMHEALQQLYLKSLPELSGAKHMIRRENVEGFSNDALRVFADAVTRGARYASHLESAPAIQAAMESAEAQTRSSEKRSAAVVIGRKDGQAPKVMIVPAGTDRLNAVNSMTEEGYATEFFNTVPESALERLAAKLPGVTDADLAKYVAEAEKVVGRTTEGVEDMRAAKALYNHMVTLQKTEANQDASPFTDALGQAGYTWFLGFSPAFWAMNTLQNPMVGIPHLGAKYGVGKASAEWLGAMKWFGGVRLGKVFADRATPFSVEWLKEAVKSGQLKGVTKQELDMLQTLEDRQVLDFTQAMDLSRIGQASSDKRYKFMRLAAAGAHHTEVFNRVTFALAAYRLALKSNGDVSHAEAVRRAENDLVAVHFDYSFANKPEMMRGKARLVFMFQQYRQHMLYWWGRNIKDIVKNEAPGDRTRALKAALLMGTTQGIFAGALGMPFVGSIAFLANLLGGGDEDGVPFDFNRWITDAAVEATGSQEAGEVMAKGIFAALGMNIGQRIGQADLFPFLNEGSAKYERNADDKMRAYLFDLAGPLGSIALGMARSSEAFARGDTAAGIAAATPKAVSDIVKAYQLETEGMKDKRGQFLAAAEAFDGADVFMQAAGVAPTRVAAIRDARGKIMDVDNGMRDRSRLITGQFVEAWSRGDRDGVAEALADIQAFNQKLASRGLGARQFLIDGRQLELAIKDRQQRAMILALTGGTAETRRQLMIATRMSGLFNQSEPTNGGLPGLPGLPGAKPQP